MALFIHGHRRILYPWVLSGQAARDFALLDLYEADAWRRRYAAGCRDG